jgi:hypothetical protein
MDKESVTAHLGLRTTMDVTPQLGRVPARPAANSANCQLEKKRCRPTRPSANWAECQLGQLYVYIFHIFSLSLFRLSELREGFIRFGGFRLENIKIHSKSRVILALGRVGTWPSWHLA